MKVTASDQITHTIPLGTDLAPTVAGWMGIELKEIP